MELSEEKGQSANPPVDVAPAQTATLSPAQPRGTTTPSYVYALGRITPRFPSLAVEKEFAQATGRAETAGLTDRQALQSVLSQRSNRYLARQLCWVLEIEGLETYLLVPRDGNRSRVRRVREKWSFSLLSQASLAGCLPVNKRPTNSSGRCIGPMMAVYPGMR